MSDIEERGQPEESPIDYAERQRRQEFLNEEFFGAIRAGNNEDVIQLISDGAEITIT